MASYSTLHILAGYNRAAVNSNLGWKPLPHRLQRPRAMQRSYTRIAIGDVTGLPERSMKSCRLRVEP